jgi:hypothetical protein
MSWLDWVDIKKRKDKIVLIDNIGGYFFGNDF